MKDVSVTVPSNAKLVKALQGQVKKLQSELTLAEKAKADEAYVAIRVAKSQSRFKRIRKQDGRDVGLGEFFLLLEVTAQKQAIYVPLSIASGKKPAGFVYQIEGTAKGDIVSATAAAQGAGRTLITLGTILYAKIPAGKTGVFRLQVETRGRIGSSYKIVLNRMHFKLNPEDARYKKLERAISTKPVLFN